MAEHTFIDLAEPAAACTALSGASRIGVDTEFMREKTYYARLCLVQFAVGDELWCADPLSADDLERFWDALLAPAWVLHSGRQDFEVVLHAAGRLPKQVFDTQVAAALLGHPPQMGYAHLVEKYFDVKLDKAHTRADWSRRPLSASVLTYAAEDVAWLLPACDRLQEQLEKRGRLEWAQQDSHELLDPSLYVTSPEAAVERVKGARALHGRARNAAAKLAAWREREAERSDKPRQWILRDAVLLDIAINNPATTDALGRIDNLASGTLRRAGDELLELLRKAESAEETYEPPSRPDAAQKALLKALQKTVSARAHELGIAAEVLAPRRELSAALEGERELRVLRGWRREQVGDAILEVLGD